ncbi:multiple inositol polyphosphate phosphatase 1 [Frankliniella occidentalis]|uniref:Multiple inositol polyphosphate phosphatase 1 n=1 Tax=Frankliniella occidentalis TaxID=133901 RepID=A0A6J1S6Q7_FRAOC|nr:multiple inositol polyphosphate phosphatase 1 [Frankliniella occidentalis]
MTWSPLLLVAALACAGQVAASTQDYCMARDANPFANFGTRTPYEASGANLDTTPVKLEGCKAVQLWLLGRHGTRHGKDADIELILKLTKIKAQMVEHKSSGRSVGLCDTDQENILNWYPNVDRSMSYQLTPQGQQDLLKMGARYRERFPDLFKDPNPASFHFKYDETDRCVESSQWFYKGIFGEFPAQSEGTVDGLPDFYNRCPAYLGPIASDFVMGDFNKFKKNNEWSDMVKRVSIRLGFYNNLDVDDIEAMYTACSFERARNWEYGKTSPWCAAFRPEDFEVLEYWFDMKEYYRTGYGHKIHEKLGCVPIKDLVKSFEARVGATAPAPPSGLIYHSHDTLLNQVVAFFGLYRDQEKMREDNFARLRDRKWRVSKFSPFASNIAAVLHECSSGDRYRVQMFLNEKLLPLQDWGCDKDSCTWTQFMSKFGHVLTNCKQRRLCWGL